MSSRDVRYYEGGDGILHQQEFLSEILDTKRKEGDNDVEHKQRYYQWTKYY